MKTLCFAFFISLFAYMANSQALNSTNVQKVELPTCPKAGETAYIEITDELKDMINCINTTDTTGTTFILEQDMWLDPKKPLPIANLPFKGTFDGNGKTIWRYYSKQSFFFRIEQSATVKDITFMQANITSSLGNFIGILAGILNGGTIENVWVEDSTLVENGKKPSAIGGLIGRMTNGVIDSCAFNNGKIIVTADGANGIGGIVGSQNDGTIKGTTSDGTLTLKGNSNLNIGGIGGVQFSGLVINSSSSLQIIVGGDYSMGTGGIVGTQILSQETPNNPLIESCSYIGKIAMWGQNVMGTGGLVGVQQTGKIIRGFTLTSLNMEGYAQQTGGLVGRQEQNGKVFLSHSNSAIGLNESTTANYTGGLIGWAAGTIAGTYAEGHIVGIGNYSAGLVGYLFENGSIKNSYSSTIISQGTMKGLVARADPKTTCSNSYWDIFHTQSKLSAACTDGGRTTQQMWYPDLSNTYVGWSNEYWNIEEGSYPSLKDVP